MQTAIIAPPAAPRKPSAPVGDPSALDRIRGWGGDALVHRIGHIFLAEAPRRIAAARDAAVHADVRGIRGAAHALRSSCGQLGALRMQTLCERIERRAARGAVAGAATLVGRLDDELVRYREWLTATLKEMEVTQ